ncbi:GDSL esterase/lipase At5g37690 isoform X3 [Carica papaya]|uniref:GDSL esterase/lipase At5g37690 isoform X3 n=1 Tax=Carica papaya TaxID=3649 RepID=UPI000B8CFDFE|nr:GDSL esterase/lipase At5g37690 isoform X3 [Carica papaya]
MTVGVRIWVGLAVASAMGALASAASIVTYVFGDSLTEVGNNNYLQYSLARSDYPWYGVDFSGGQATGRFTNGRTIGDIISAKLGIPSPPPYLSVPNNVDKLLQGVNYASGGAGILNETGLYFIQRLSFDDQINYFKKTKEAIEAKIGEDAANKHLNEALYFIGIGSNDYVNNFLQPFLADGQQYTHEEFVELLTSTLDNQLMRLYELGARKVLFHGLGPLGCIPSQRVKSRKGFKISNTSCCNVDTSIGGLCLPNSKLCRDRRYYVFWDAFHPSDAANEVLANELFASSLFTSLAPPPKPH